MRSVRRYDGPRPTTVEELKDAMAEVGLDPDDVARLELLHWSGQGDDITIVERLADGRVRTFYRERGDDRDHREWPDEASAVADLAQAVDRANGRRRATDLEVDRLRERAARHREVWRTHGS